MTVITASYAQKALIEAGYPVKELHTIEEGSNHFVFIVVLHDTSRLICKFAKVRKTEQNIGSVILSSADFFPSKEKPIFFQ